MKIKERVKATMISVSKDTTESLFLFNIECTLSELFWARPVNYNREKIDVSYFIYFSSPSSTLFVSCVYVLTTTLLCKFSWYPMVIT